LLSKNIRIKTFSTVILPVIFKGVTWSLAQTEEQIEVVTEDGLRIILGFEV
jgi:hypothetical protein